MLTVGQQAALTGMADNYAEAEACAVRLELAAKVLPESHVIAQAERARKLAGRCRQDLTDYLKLLTEQPVSV